MKAAWVAIAALAMLLAVSAPGQARPGGRGIHEGSQGTVMPRGFDGHGVDGHHGLDGRHRFDHRFGFAVGPIYPYPYSYPYGYYPYGYYPYYGYPVPSYLYYCRSAGAYYPAVESCPDG